MVMPTLTERINGGLWGVLVADALGVPFQFKAASSIPPREEIGMTMPTSFSKTFRKIAYGTWSDDGALTLALMDSLTKCGRLDLAHFADNVIGWFDKGHFTVDGSSYDVGNTTLEAVLRLQRGHPPEASGLDAENSNGNGSLMRTLPLALWHQGTDAELYTDAGRASGVTHRHDVAKAACGVYCVAARHILNGVPVARALIDGLKLAHIPLDLPQIPGGSGYVLDSLSFAIQSIRGQQSYQDVVLDAIQLGADTDTTACIAGGLVGVRDGDAAIPRQWLFNLRGHDMAARYIDAFLQARVSSGA